MHKVQLSEDVCLYKNLFKKVEKISLTILMKEISENLKKILTQPIVNISKSFQCLNVVNFGNFNHEQNLVVHTPQELITDKY